MARRRGRRRRRGVLSTLAKGSTKKSTRKPSTLRRVLTWTVGIVAGIAILAAIVLFAAVSFNPTIGARSEEGEVVVEEFRESPRGFGDDVVAAAAVSLEGQRVLIPLERGEEQGVLVGARLRVAYTFFPRTRSVRVDSWELVRE